jgi:carboxypeptidase C (cathepsin A)
MYKKQVLLIGLFLLTAGMFSAESLETSEKKDNSTLEIPKERSITTNHSVKIDSKEIKYQATAGTLLIKSDDGKSKGSVFYVAYTKEGVADNSKRPITFCFNGGPGSSSVWLHLGTFGPRRVLFDEKGYANPPYGLVDNEYSLLDVTDLVFIDPVSTGYSRACPGEDAKQFHGVDEDVKSIANFIRLFVTKNNRWDSPKYLAGESYGTTRAAALAGYLHEDQYLYCNGVILISSILNFQTINDYQNGNDLPYILYLPTYTKVAAYYKKLSPELLKNMDKTIEDVQNFALKDYTYALMQGDNLDAKSRSEIIDKLSLYTGLSKDFIDRENLRINNMHFSKELLRSERRTVGRFDGRYTGIDSNGCCETFEYDPSADAIFGAFTATFNDYIRRELQWDSDEEYKILTSVTPWNYNKAANQYLNVGENLREVMTRNPSLQVFVGSGYYDLATPYFATDYTFNHLNLDPSLRPHITKKYYDGGHMMYVQKNSLIKLKQDLADFFK